MVQQLHIFSIIFFVYFLIFRTETISFVLLGFPLNVSPFLSSLLITDTGRVFGPGTILPAGDTSSARSVTPAHVPNLPAFPQGVHLSKLYLGWFRTVYICSKKVSSVKIKVHKHVPNFWGKINMQISNFDSEIST